MAGRRTKKTATEASTREALIDGALRTLRDRGFSGASARAIASAAGVNQALVFYHFGSLNGLLLAALDNTGEQRLERYRAAVAEARSLDELIGVAIRIYREDLEQGHMTVVAEMIAGSLADEYLRPEIIARANMWMEFVEETLRPYWDRSPFAQLASAKDIAFAVIAFYAGINLFSRLEDDHAQMNRLFDTAGKLGPLLAPLFGS